MPCGGWQKAELGLHFSAWGVHAWQMCNSTQCTQHKENVGCRENDFHVHTI